MTSRDPGECELGGNAITEQNEEFISKYWEVEAPETLVQITDVQGRLKQKLSFWRETLQAPPWLIDYIEKGYRLLWLCDNGKSYISICCVKIISINDISR